MPFANLGKHAAKPTRPNLFMVVSNDDDPPPNPFGVKLKKRAPSGRAKVGKQLTGLADTPPKPSPAKSPSKNLSPQKSKKAVTPPAAPPPPPPPLSAEAAEIAGVLQ